MASILFRKYTLEQYRDLEVKDENTLYWLTDAQELWRGTKFYGKGAAAAKLAARLKGEEYKKKLDDLPDGDIFDHRSMTHRDAEEQHPIGAISGLQAALDSIPVPMTAEQLRKILMNGGK